MDLFYIIDCHHVGRDLSGIWGRKTVYVSKPRIWNGIVLYT